MRGNALAKMDRCKQKLAEDSGTKITILVINCYKPPSGLIRAICKCFLGQSSRSTSTLNSFELNIQSQNAASALFGQSST